MSLILDALRKSAGDRQRGHAPTLASAVGLTPRRRAHPARMPVALALLAGTAGAGWWLGFGTVDAPRSDALADGSGAADLDGGSTAADFDSPPIDRDGLLAAAPSLADSLPALRPEAVQLPLDDLEPRMGEAQSRSAGGVVAAGGGAALPMPAGTVYTPEVMVAPSGTPAPEATTPSVAPAPEPPQPGPEAPSPVASVILPSNVPAPVPQAAVEPAEKLQTVDQLDYAVRRELPSLEISMYVYNADPERRFLIIGGKRYPRLDGVGNRISRIDDKVDLLEIRADGAVLEFNGQRFLLPRGR